MRAISCEDPRKEIACVGHKIVAVLGESVLVSVSVSVSASWNASFTRRDTSVSLLFVDMSLFLPPAYSSVVSNGHVIQVIYLLDLPVEFID